MEDNVRENFHASSKILSRLPTPYPLGRKPLFYTIETKNADVLPHYEYLKKFNIGRF